MKKIIIFGGSFNPIHNGHVHIATKALEQLNADRIYFVPTYKSTFKEAFKISDIHRKRMIQNIVKKNDKFHFNWYELNIQNEKSYLTVKYFKEKFQDAQIYFLIGSDNLEKFHLWDEAETMAKDCQMLYYLRNNEFKDHENIKKYNFLKIDGENLDISSTNIRNGTQVINCIDETNLDYINDNGLYITDRLKHFLKSSTRYEHCLRVGNLARRFAHFNYPNLSQKAYIAGCYHDLAKELDEKTMLYYRDKFDKNINPEPYENDSDYRVLHGYVAAWILKNQFGYQDEELLNSIYYHTIINTEEPTPLEKIVYLADKLESHRVKQDINRYFKINKAKALAYKNIHQAFQLTHDQIRKYVQMKNEQK
ncbi:nicotinate-nucleotide adenylyltransferase [Mycoplasma bradburyae]|uniref:nicotinate-nucleotide adenylyltransferase n=1 Tax=Mycoplasma bradburyae TaxID=2963128 RepID=UPI00233F7CBC|nr:nicotinate-nucleotide adenylyltransferase [Mycoplasma bradburyae]MDC4183781.1 nicotinate-nucleotide adenylyltransferase [Mycoplasma bradburyae]